MAVTDQQLLDLVLDTDCYRALDATEQRKVDLAIQGKTANTPRSNIGRVAFYLARRIHPISTPPPPTPTIQELGRNVMFTAWNPEAALRCPPKWRVAISAEPTFDTAARMAAPKIKARGNLLAVWGVQTQIGAARIKQFAAEVGADFVIFQAETPDEYDTAVGAGAKLIVGNPNNWTQAQRDDAIARGNTLTTLFEVYSNEGSPWPDAASSRNVPISSEVLGVGFGATPYQLADYKPHTPAGVWATISVYLAEYMNEQSWSMLP